MLRTDFHCHLLPGLDHGSRSAAESLVMARGLQRLGVERVHVTPHQLRWDLRHGPADLRARTAGLQEQLTQAGVALTLVPGAEYYYGEDLLDAVVGGAELLTAPAPDAGDARGQLLVELPLREPAVGVTHFAARVAQRGWCPVLAHPERMESVQRDPARLLRWVEAGWRPQLDLLSLVGAYGRAARRTARALLEAGRYALVGSDLHRPQQLEPLARAHATWRALAVTELEA